MLFAVAAPPASLFVGGGRVVWGRSRRFDRFEPTVAPAAPGRFVWKRQVDSCGCDRSELSVHVPRFEENRFGSSIGEFPIPRQYRSILRGGDCEDFVVGFESPTPAYIVS